LIGSFNLRDLVVSEPTSPLGKIMRTEPRFLYDNQKVGDIAELISKYNLLAVAVVDEEKQLQGMVVVDDVVEDLIKKRRTKKK
jgi:magnesium transporter